MRRFLKFTFKLVAALVAVVFINGCIYVFTGQDRTMEKILAGEKVSLYDKNVWILRKKFGGYDKNTYLCVKFTQNRYGRELYI